MVRLIALIALIDGGLSRPYDLLPREWRTELVKCTYAIDGCQACHCSHLSLHGAAPRGDYLTLWMASMHRWRQTASQLSARQGRHQYSPVRQRCSCVSNERSQESHIELRPSRTFHPISISSLVLICSRVLAHL
ncbi:hypothetical protein V8E51_004220 [Hyaloscypha variabilis]